MSYELPVKRRYRFTFLSRRLDRYAEQLKICGAQIIEMDYDKYQITFAHSDIRAFNRAFKYQQTAGSTMKRENLDGGAIELPDD